MEEEADVSEAGRSPTLYWLEILVESGLISAENLKSLMSETNAVLAMTVASIKTLRNKTKQSLAKNPESKTQNLKIQNSNQIQNPKSKIQNPKLTDYVEN